MNSPKNIINLKFGSDEDGNMVMSYNAGRWRCAEYERRKAEDDNKRIEARMKAKERL